MQILNYLTNPTILLILSVVFLLIILVKWHSDNSPFDFREALINPKTTHISFTKLAQLIALYISTSIILFETANNRLTEWLFMAYITTWAGSYAYTKYLNSKKKDEIPNDN